MAMTKRQLKAADDRINRIYCANCSGIQISVLDIPKVFAAGRKLVEEGYDDTALTAEIVKYVNAIRKN